MRHRCLLLAAIATAVAGCSGPCATEEQSTTAKGVVTRCVTAADTALANAVYGQLSTEPSLEGADIHVSAAGGIVTLKGSVPDEHARGRAQKLCYAVDGVDRVENNLLIVQSPVSRRAM